MALSSSFKCSTARNSERETQNLYLPLLQNMNFDKGSVPSNLDSFLRSTAPVVRSTFLLKRDMRGLNRLWHPWERERVEYFRLSDLWNSYQEWSVYGVGVPIVLEDCQKLTQYYAPYLSGIQIFTSNSSFASIKEETESVEWQAKVFSRDRISDVSEGEKLHRRGANSPEVVASEHGSPLHSNDRLGSLYFQHFDSSSPYGRLPLIDMIKTFTKKYPGLMTLRSVDLSPATWLSVAWYPIYHIPMGRTIKDLSASFLTYHTLSSSFHDGIDGGKRRRRGEKEASGMTLPSFGLATYKMQGDLWSSGNNGQDKDRLVSLSGAAGCWLKQLRVQHHDYNFFTGGRRR